MKIINAVFLVVLALAVLSCAKNRPPVLTAAQQRDLISIADIKKNSNFKITTTAIKEPYVDSVNKITHSAVNIESVPALFRLAFQNMLVESEPTSNLDIKIDLRDDKKLVVYKNIPSDQVEKLSLFERSLVEKEGYFFTDYLVPVFYFDVGYVKLVVKKNEKGEETRDYDVFETTKSDAQYVRINFEYATRSVVKNQFDENQEIVLEKNIFEKGSPIIKATLYNDDKHCRTVNTKNYCEIAKLEAPKEFKKFEALEPLLNDLSLNTPSGETSAELIVNIKRDKDKTFLEVNRVVISGQDSDRKKIDYSQRISFLTSSEKIRLNKDSSGNEVYSLFSIPAIVSTPTLKKDDKGFTLFSLNVISNIEKGSKLIISSDKNQRSFFMILTGNDQQLSKLETQDRDVSVSIKCPDKTPEGVMETHVSCSVELKESKTFPVIEKLFDKLTVEKRFAFSTDEMDKKIKEKAMKVLVRFLDNNRVSLSLLVPQTEKMDKDLELSFISYDKDTSFRLMEVASQGVKYQKRKHPVDSNGREETSFYVLEDTTKENSDMAIILGIDSRSLTQIEKRDDYLMDKSKFDLNSAYMYVPSAHEIPAIAVFSLHAFLQGEPQLVKFRLSENTLDVFTLELDTLPSDINKDPLNRSIINSDHMIAQIPISHIDYSRKKDSFGNYSNIESVDNSIPWEKRRFFTIKLGEINSWNLGSAHHAAGLKNSECYDQKSKKIKKDEFNRDRVVLNENEIEFEVEESYSVNASKAPYCLHLRRGLSFLDISSKEDKAQFQMSFYHSFKKYSELRKSKYEAKISDYEALEYPKYDQSFFGFFAKKVINYNNNQEGQERFYLERWNPKRQKIVYHLSESFRKPENKIYRNLTEKSIFIINEGLKEAGIGFKVELAPEDELYTDKPGSLSYNTVALVDEEAGAGSLLGYCPAVADPLNGEIIKSHIVMYGSTMKKMARRIYNRIAYEKNRQIVAPVLTRKIKEEPMDVASSKDVDSDDLKKIGDYRDFNFKSIVSELDKKSSLTSNNFFQISELLKNLDSSTKNNIQSSLSHPMQFMQENMKLENLQKDFLNRYSETDPKMKEIFTSFQRETGKTYDQFLEDKKRLEYEIDKNITTAEEISLDLISGDRIKKIADVPGTIDRDGHYKVWDELSDEVRKIITDGIISAVYVSTFVHEFGHGLGLRHNFKSNMDHDHFLKHKKVGEYSIDSKYSSVMDYGDTFFGELPVYGPYDIAALKFGYSRKIEFIATEERGDVQEYQIPHGETFKDFTASKIEELNNKTEKIEKRDTEDKTPDFLKGLKKNQKKKKYELKNYLYCTDEDTLTDPFCMRHVEGQDLEELANFHMDRFNRYLYRQYSDENTHLYSNNATEQINEIVDMFELFFFLKRVSYMADVADIYQYFFCMDPQKLDNTSRFSCEQFASSKKAAKKINKFFINHIVTPDHYCIWKKMTNEDDKDFNWKANSFIDEEFFKDQKETIKIESIKKLFEEYIQNGGRKNLISFPRTCFDSRISDRLNQRFSELKSSKQGPTDNKNEVVEKKYTEFKVIGEYGRILTDIEFLDGYGLPKNELWVKGSLPYKFISAYFTALPMLPPFAVDKELTNLLIANTNIQFSPFLKEYYDSIFLGKPLVYNPVYIRTDDKGMTVETSLSVQFGDIYNTNSGLDHFFNIKQGTIDLNQEIVHFMVETEHASLKKNGLDIIREQVAKLLYGHSGMFAETASLLKGSVKTDFGQTNEGVFYAFPENIYAYELIKRANFVLDGQDFMDNIVLGKRIEDIDQMTVNRLVYALKQKEPILKDLSSALNFNEEICAYPYNSKIQVGPIPLRNIWNMLTTSTEERRANLNEYLDMKLKGKFIDGEIPDDYMLVWAEMYTTLQNEGCVKNDYQTLKKILTVYDLGRKKFSDVVGASEFAHAVDLNQVGIHAQYLSLKDLETLYLQGIENGVDEYVQVKGVSEIFFGINDQAYYARLSDKLVEMTKDVGLIQKYRKAEEDFKLTFDFLDAATRRYDDITWLLGDVNNIGIYDLDEDTKKDSTNKEDIEEYLRSRRVFSEDKINEELKKLKQDHQRRANKIVENHKAIVHEAIEKLRKIDNSEATLKLINEAIALEEKTTQKGNAEVAYKNADNLVFAQLNKVRMETIKSIVDRLFDLKTGSNEDKIAFESFISELESEVSISRFKTVGKKTNLKLSQSFVKQLRKIDLKPKEVQEMKNTLFFHLSRLFASYSSAQRKSEWMFKKRYEDIKEADKKLSDVININGSADKMLEPFRESYEALDAAYGDTHGLMDIKRKLKILVPVGVSK